MKKILGSGFYLTAAVCLASAGTLDPITAAAVAGLVALAFLAVTKHADWAAFGGGLMIAVSLFLQSILSYRCLDCIRADLLILAGVISLSVIDRGTHRRTLGILSAVITVFVAATIAVHYDPPAVFGLERGREVLAQPEVATGAACPEEERGNPAPAEPMTTASGQTSSEKTGGKQPERIETPRPQPGASGDPPKAMAPEDPERFIRVETADGGIITLDAAQKPVLFFSPTCGACVRAVEALAKADPEGGKWVPVQAYGDPAVGRELLRDKGYRGKSYVYVSRWKGAVPVMVAVRDGMIFKTGSPEEILKKARGDAD
ncbi:MAG: hypothetical protein K6T66_14590 [Peptococcaceae bacterium]|nr:hypothetical protein [Peptococcaceae bacterium]